MNDKQQNQDLLDSLDNSVDLVDSVDVVISEGSIPPMYSSRLSTSIPASVYGVDDPFSLRESLGSGSFITRPTGDE